MGAPNVCQPIAGQHPELAFPGATTEGRLTLKDVVIVSLSFFVSGSDISIKLLKACFHGI